MSNPVDDLKAVYETAKNPGYEPRKEDIRYFLTLLKDGRPDIVKMVVMNIWKKNSTSEISRLDGYVYGKPNTRVRVEMPYLTFDSLEALREYYIRELK